MKTEAIDIVINNWMLKLFSLMNPLPIINPMLH